MEERFTFADLFAGIGGLRLAFEAAGGKCAFSCEIDPKARRTYRENFGEEPAGDIREVAPEEVPDVDVIAAGFPCQTFSVIGKREGFADKTRGTLFFEVLRLARAKRPAALLLENVRGLVSHDGGRTLEAIMGSLGEAGYAAFWEVLTPLSFGIPQSRPRIFIAAFDRERFPGLSGFAFPDGKGFPDVPLSGILEEDPDPRLFVRDEIRASRLRRSSDPGFPRPYISHENRSGSVTPHPWSAALRAGASANYILVNDERRPSVREMLRLQGFPESFSITLPYTDAKRQCGNSVCVPVAAACAAAMRDASDCFGKGNRE